MSTYKPGDVLRFKDTPGCYRVVVERVEGNRVWLRGHPDIPHSLESYEIDPIGTIRKRYVWATADDATFQQRSALEASAPSDVGVLLEEIRRLEHELAQYGGLQRADTRDPELRWQPTGWFVTSVEHPPPTQRVNEFLYALEDKDAFEACLRGLQWVGECIEASNSWDSANAWAVFGQWLRSELGDYAPY